MFAMPPLPSFSNPFADENDDVSKKLSIKATEKPSHEIEFQFNPSEFKLNRTVAWDDKAVMRGGYGLLDFKNANSDTLTLTALLDATEGQCMGQDDIADAVKKLYDISQPWVEVDSVSQQRPPLCHLLWADFKFSGVISKLDVNYLVFGDEGAPLRAEISLEIKGRAFAQVDASAFFVADEVPTAPE
jgi:hypothetical protein